MAWVTRIYTVWQGSEGELPLVSAIIVVLVLEENQIKDM